MGVIRILSRKGWFTIPEYNEALKSHSFKSYEGSDRPFPLDNPKARKLKGKAVSIWTHMRCFGMVINNHVKDINDEVLDFGMELSEITERLTASEFRDFEIELLEDRIFNYLDMRKNIFDQFPDLLGTPKPKHHFLCHYGDAIRKFGPPLSFWTGRFESKHRVAKGTAESAKNFVNITSTLAVRQQMRMASKYYNGMCDTAVVHMPDAVTKKEDLPDGSEMYEKLRVFMREDDVLCSKIVVNCQEFKIGDIVVINATDRDSLEVGVIQTILVKTGGVSFVSRKYETCRNKLNFFVSQCCSDEFYFIDPFQLADFKPLIRYGTDAKFRYYLHHHISFSYE